MATAQDIIDNSIARARDPDSTQWTDARLLVYLNDALDYIRQLLIERRSRLVIDTGTITTTSGTDTYAFSSFSMSDFLAVYEGNESMEGGRRNPSSLYWNKRTGVYCGQTFLMPVDPEKVVDYASYTLTSTTPTMYYILSDSIGFLPPIGGAYTVTVEYYSKASDLSLSDSMPYSGIFNRPVSRFMSNMAFVENGYITADFTTLYNELERAALSVVDKRDGIQPRLRYRVR